MNSHHQYTRTERIQRTLKAANLDALVCALPMNVLLLSGYWPVVGTGVAMASHDGRVQLLIPEDEKDLAKSTWAGQITTFRPSSLDAITTPMSAISEPLRGMAQYLSGSARIGIEVGEISEPASYAAMHLYQRGLETLLKTVFPPSELVPADDLLATLRALKTHDEILGLRTACRIAEQAFTYGSSQLRAGITEFEAAQLFRAPLSTSAQHFKHVQRTDGFVSCMSGANSALAHGAYARSRGKQLEPGDLVLAHCNSYVDGRWTDITRTYSLGKPNDRRQAMYSAVLAARDAALRAIEPGQKASDVDKAARSVIEARGFGQNFKHSTGHGVGFSAICPNAKPMLHPKSDERLEIGMVFNLEPAIYIDDYGGIRHCDMVALTETGPELLTPFQSHIEDLFLGARG